ncbi:MAG TPA: ABC transporter substrate-binding protein [Baekduia sp.]|uniref:ABC transporter substrate-binding protein n=1 Tax=Baekduia sp. TaxID=2600305 RepID=UPI002D779CD8|nr:ABC transporter substrate-binding protein [Baekduia sp.]HET6507888.1 ABC transporter substrate-binding protein [Baekduia sp.]
MLGRKTSRALGAVAGCTLLAAGAGCGSGSDSAAGSGGGGGGSSSSPIKVGVVTPSSGPLVELGSSILKGWEYAAAEMNAHGGMDGHKLEIVKNVTDGTPAVSTRAARAAVSKGAKVITGMVTSAEVGATQAQLAGMGALYLNTSGSDAALTGDNCSSRAFHFIPSTSSQVEGVGSMAGTLPAKKYALILYDYSTGHTAAAAITKAVKAAGAQVVKTVYVPIATTDFGSAITQIKSSGADGMFGMISGSGSSTFLTQAKQFGLLGQLKVRMGYSMVSDINWDGIGQPAAGFYDSQIYDVKADNPANAAFVKGFEAKYGREPNYDEANAYLAAEVLRDAVAKAHSTAPDALRSALTGGTFDDTIMGATKFNASNTLERPWYVGQVKAKPGGGFEWKVVKSLDPANVVPAGTGACSK